jgi:hypothetical protein
MGKSATTMGFVLRNISVLLQLIDSTLCTHQKYITLERISAKSVNKPQTNAISEQLSNYPQGGTFVQYKLGPRTRLEITSRQILQFIAKVECVSFVFLLSTVNDFETRMTSSCTEM